MQLLAACQKSPTRRAPGREVDDHGLRRQPLATPRCSPRTWAPSGCRRSGYAKDVYEVEGYVRGFARRRPDVDVTMIRARQRGRARTSSSPLTSYFRLPVVPARAGLRPAAAVPPRGRPAAGAAPRRDHRRARHLQRRRRRDDDAVPGRPPPRHAVGLAAALRGRSARRRPCARPASSDFSPEQLGFLTYGRGVDTTRMRTVLGFEPRSPRPRRSPTSASALAPATARDGAGRA